MVPFTGSYFRINLSLFFENDSFSGRQFRKIKNIYFRLVIGGVILGVLIYFFPPFYGEGYDTIMSLLQGNADTVFANSIFEQVSDNFFVIVMFMLGLVLLKVVASSSTNGAGGVGGIFAPTLFIGGYKWIHCCQSFEKIYKCEYP